MKYRKRSFGLPFMISALLMSALAACGGGGDAERESSGDVKGSGAELAGKVSAIPTELVFYVAINGWTESQFMESYGNQIKKKFPDYTLKFIPQVDGKTLPNLIASGQTIDILISSIGLTSNNLLAYDMQYDISDLIKKYKFDLSPLEPSTIEIQRQLANGGIYGLPVSTTSAALFYNKSLFDKFGVPYPREGMTWDEIYELAKRMTRNEGGLQYKGMTMSFQHLMTLNQLSAQHIDPKTLKAQFTNELFRQAFENLSRFYSITGNELVDKKYNLASQQDPFYKTGNIAMYAALSSSSKVFKNMVDWDMVQLPYFKDKQGVGPQSYPNYFYLSGASTKKDAAFQVLAYVTSEEYQDFIVRDGTNSILKDPGKINANFAVDEPALKGKNVKAMLPAKFADSTLKTKFQAIADKELIAALLEVAANGKDVNSALREASDRVDKAILSEQQK